jgi:hypothetical protein
MLSTCIGQAFLASCWSLSLIYFYVNRLEIFSKRKRILKETLILPCPIWINETIIARTLVRRDWPAIRIYYSKYTCYSYGAHKHTVCSKSNRSPQSGLKVSNIHSSKKLSILSHYTYLLLGYFLSFSCIRVLKKTRDPLAGRTGRGDR